MPAGRTRGSLSLPAILSAGRRFSGETLAARLGISRQALHKQVQGLRKKGYRIEGRPKSGYRLLREPDQLTAERVAGGLRARLFGRRLLHFPQIDSTQEKAKGLAARGAPEGTVVVAEKQISGRGRFLRAWSSEAGGVWASIILRPRLSPQQVPLLSLVASLAIAEAMEKAAGARGRLKWPNDILLEGGRGDHRKVCGILTEMAAESDRVHWVVLGFGINVNNVLPRNLKRRAVSLSEFLGAPVDRPRFFQAVLESLERYYLRFLEEGFGKLRRDYLRRFLLAGKEVTVRGAEGESRGRVLGVGEDGSLILLAKGGGRISFLAGDVSLPSAFQ